MAKKKKQSSKTKKPAYLVDLYGIVLMLISILGIGKYGPVGRIISSFSVFLVGSLYFFLLVFIFLIGCYLLIKKEYPKFFSSKMIGLYLIVIGVLVLIHQNYVIDATTKDIISKTFENIMTAMEGIMESTIETGVFSKSLANTGGGMIGSLFGAGFYKLFEAQGATIVVWILIATGIMIFTGFSIFDFIKNTLSKGKEMLLEPDDEDEDEDLKKSNLSKTDKFKIVDHNEDFESNKSKEKDKLAIHDISEITKIKSINESQDTKIETEEAITEKPIIKEAIVPTNTSYKLPPLSILDAPPSKKNKTDHTVIEKNIEKLEKVLRDFGISGKVVEVNVGPSVIQYELEIQSGTKLSRILSINNEIALELAKKDVRIQAPIPGKSTVGIEMPNENSQMVTIRETLEGIKEKADSLLAVALGKNILGKACYCEINKTPHLLVAGSTGSGKSVCINGIIISILMKAKPDEVKLIMVDPKKVELSIYNGIPHLLIPVVTDPKKASLALKRAVSEMERRYDMFEETKTKNITSYNKYIEEQNKKLPADEQMKKMPYIVVIVDELADLMLVAGKEVEDSIMRITQMARAAGIHLIIATQRPSTDVITGLIKANIPSRISFAVSSSIDSRTILDRIGAEKLLGKGDMLFLPMGEIAPERIQGAYISEEEIKRVVDYVVAQQIAQYDANFMNLEEKDEEIKNNPISNDPEEYDDPLYNEVVEFVVTTGKASASLLQRKFKLGYNRAARIIDLLEERGIIGPQNGSKPREVLITIEKDDQNNYEE